MAPWDDDPAARPHGSRLPRRAFQEPFARSQGRQRFARADASRRHRRHSSPVLAAGATSSVNTFNSTAVAQADYGFESIVYELNVEGARLAVEACAEWTARTPDRPRFAAGAIGPTNKTLSISPDVNNPAFRAIAFDDLCRAYKEQVRGLIDGGCHLLLLETIFDTLNAKAAIVAIEEVLEEKGLLEDAVRPPLMISVTVTDLSGRTLSGQTIDAFWVSMVHARPFSIGLNCALGARDMRPYLAELARIADRYISCYPNAGLPNAFGQYDEQPKDTSAYLREFATSGFVNIVGGCCGTTPDHIAAIANAVEGLAPRPLHQRADNPDAHYATGWPRDPHDPSRRQLPDDRRADQHHRLGPFRTVDPGGNYADAARVALEQVRGGANLIDVNMDEGMLDSEQAMTEFLCYIATEPRSPGCRR
jgi:5-methyltetrahydrofolate--homocysteine methyltransferase